MAILIPSKNIYQKQNNKIVNNVIRSIEVNATKVSPDNDYETTVYNEDIYGKGTPEVAVQQQDEQKRYEGGLGYLTRIYASYSIIPHYYQINIKIPKVSNNHYIKNILYKAIEENDKEVSQIKTSFAGNIYSEVNTISSAPEGNDGRLDFSILHTEPKYTLSVEDELIEISPALEYTFVNQSQSQSITATIKEKFTNAETIKNPSFVDNDTEYELSFKLLYQYEEIMFGGYYEYEFADISNIGNPTWQETKSASKKIIVDKIEITVYGDTIGIDLSDNVITIGEESKKVFSVDSNELMQTTNYEEKETQLIENTDYRIGTSSNASETWFYTSVHLYNKYPLDTYVEYTTLNGKTETAIIKAFSTTHSPAIASALGYVTIDRVYRPLVSTTYECFKQTKEQYSKGKETATVLCDINDYYAYDSTKTDFKGEKAIDISAPLADGTTKLVFENYDEVVPMIKNPNGAGDKPMSTNTDGTPKVFKVLGAKRIFDGAVWQELSLQEV